MPQPPHVAHPAPHPAPLPTALPPSAPRTRGRIASGIMLAIAIPLTLVMVSHSLLPGTAGTLVAVLLPWFGWLLPLLLLAALLIRRLGAWIALLAPLIAWSLIVAPVLLPLTGTPAPASTATDTATDSATNSATATSPTTTDRITVASQNVRGGAGTAAESARTLADAGADIIALVELDATDREAAATELAETHPYVYTVGTVGLWSVYPMEHTVPLDLGLGWKRALSADVQTPGGVVGVYVVHAASVRPGSQDERDAMLDQLGELVPQELSERLLVVGDFNATVFDPALAPLLETVREPAQSSLSWGFTWPAERPVARIDHIFARGLSAVENRVLEAGASDHRAVLASFAMPEDR